MTIPERKMPPSDIPPFPADTASDIPPFPGEAGPAPSPPVKPESSRLSRVLASAAGKATESTKSALLTNRYATNALSLADMVASIPATAVGVAEDLGMRFYGAAKGMSRREAGDLAQVGYQKAAEAYGNPIHRLISAASLGPKEEGKSDVDSVMGRLTKMVENGGEWVEKHTNGVVLKTDVESLAHTAMMAGGVKGLKAGLEKVIPQGPMALARARLTPDALKALEEYRAQESKDPTAAKQVAEGRVQEQLQAKTRLQEGKDLVFNPVTGELAEKVPEPGKALPQPSTLERALEKKASGKGFDLTAEELAAYREHMNKPLDSPIVDEAGNVLRRGGKGQGQVGAIDPKLLARMAGLGVGAWAGLYFGGDKDFMDAVIGGVAGFGAAGLDFGKAVKTFKTAVGPDSRIKVNELADAHEKFTKMAAVDVWSQQKQIEDLVPDQARRNAITHAIEKGDLSDLSPKEQQAAKIAQKYFDDVGGVANLEGVLKSGRENYVTHIWDWSRNDKSLVQKWLDRGSGTAGMSPQNRFAQERSYATIEEGKQAGLTPLTEDISRIMGIYGNSMSRSIANSILVKALKNEKVPGTDQGLVLPADKAPHSYVSINNPSLAGMRVHPDIAPSLKMLYDTSSPGAAMKILQGLSDTTKRTAVSFSLFHAKALTDAMIGGSKHPLRAVGKIPSFVKGTDAYLQELKKGSASPLVERALEGGLTFSLEHTGPAVEDAGAGFYATMSSLQGTLDKAIPGAGLPVKGLIELNHKIDTIMWARLHAGMKLNMFAEKYQELIDNSAKKGKPLDLDVAARMAASYTNDIFGGLNWRRVAEDATTRFGRELGQATLNPGARRVLQLLMFAPDWTISTTRAAVKAFGKPDMLRPTTLAGLHQQYLLRSAAYYLIVGDAINYTMSGHHIWQNNDPTVLDMDEKGKRHMQWSKHTMEPVHWMTKPGQQAINKLGALPKEALEQTLGVEYLSAKGRMPPMKSRVAHALKNVEPISVQQGQGTFDPAAILASFAGVPVYGKTEEQQREAKRQRAKEREAEKRKKREERE